MSKLSSSLPALTKHMDRGMTRNIFIDIFGHVVFFIGDLIIVEVVSLVRHEFILRAL
jgi:hypothetical protein